MLKYCYNIFLALDQLANTVLFGFPDETISSRAGKRQLEGKLFPAKQINWLFFWQENHCLNSIEWDEGRAKNKVLRLSTFKKGQGYETH